MADPRPSPSRPPVSQPWWRQRARFADLGVLVLFVVGAFLLYRPLWLDLDGTYLVNSGQDQNMWEWFFAVTAHNLVNLDNPLSSTLQNYPLGVNLMANTAMLGIGIPLTPVTLLFGPTATFALALSGGLAGTAAAWYWVLLRHVVTTRAGAAVGAAFCGFAPSIVSHANAHPNFVVLFVIPFIVLRLLKLARGERPVAGGVVLGLLVAYQILLGEEALLIAATTLAVFAVTYALSRPAEVAEMAAPLGKGIGVGALVAGALVAFPLWWQFSGPQSYGSLEHGLLGNDVAAFTSFATQSLAGGDAAEEFSINRTEENAFFGWPLVLLLLFVTVALWRVVAARAVAVAMLVLAWISMGAVLVVHGEGTSLPAPWAVLFDLPLFDSVLESRFALGCVPAVGVLLAMATERVLRLRVGVEWRYALRVCWGCVLAVALVPLVPVELPTIERDATPQFFADGTWRRFVEPGGSVVAVPLPDTGDARPLRWQVDTGLEFPLAEGYFVGPDDEGNGIYGAVRTPTSQLIEDVSETGQRAPVDLEDKTNAVVDLKKWRADVVVLPIQGEDPPTEQALYETVSELLNDRGRAVGDAWVWDVRTLTPA